MDTTSIRNDSREVPPEETPHACMGGWVFLGFEGEDGEEVIEAVPCKRCTQERR
jgi:hypothetical protein